MKLATWNVNSVRARLDRLLAWLDTARPDVLCLQELKTQDAEFPTAELLARGYHAATFGQKTYNGVAILARAPLGDVERGFGDGTDDPEARFLAATVGGLRIMSVYVPNGRAVGSERFAWKLAWMDRLRGYLVSRLVAGCQIAVCGDFNVAPAALDVHDPVGWDGQLLCSADERMALDRLRSVGLVDVIRQLHPDVPLYTWWDYRQLAFPRNHGLRIDHILATPALAARVQAGGVDREARKGKGASDHAPVWIELV